MRTRMVHLGFPKIRGPYFSTCTYILVLTKIKVVCKSSTRQCTRRYVQDIGTMNVHVIETAAHRCWHSISKRSSRVSVVRSCDVMADAARVLVPTLVLSRCAMYSR